MDGTVSGNICANETAVSYLCFLCNKPCDAPDRVALVHRNADIPGPVTQSCPDLDLVPDVGNSLAFLFTPPLNLVVAVLSLGLLASCQIDFDIVKILLILGRIRAP